MPEPLLALVGVHKSFGGVRAVRDLSFHVGEGEVVGLIGPNGSGKSTTVQLVAGALTASAGDIRVDGRSVKALPVSARVPLGLARTFQTTSLFPEYTVEEQVLLGCHTRFRCTAAASVLQTRSSRRDDAEQRDRAFRILEFVGLADLASVPAAAISSARQRLLMIAMALASEPRVLLLDEPAAGMVASERKALARVILGIRERGVGVLVIEHHMGLILEICQRIVVLNFGEKLAEGTPAEIRNDPRVIDAYLGNGRPC